MSNNPQVVIGVLAQDQAKQVLQGVDDKVKQTAQEVENASNKTQSASSRMATAFKQNFGNIAQTALGLASTVTNLVITFNNLEDTQIAVRAQEVALERNTTALESAQLRLNTMVEKGVTSGEKYEIAQRKVADLQQNQEVIQLRLTDAQEKVNETYMQFIAGIGPQLLVSGQGIIGMLGSMGVGIDAVRIKTVLLNATMKLTFLTTPWGIAILAVSAAIAALAFNIGGVRDKVFELGNAIMQFLDRHFKPLADAIRWFFDNVLKPLGVSFDSELPNSIKQSENAVDSFGTTLDSNANAIFDYQTELDKAIDTHKKVLPEALAITNTALNGTQAVVQRNIELYGAMGRIALENSAVLAGSVVRASQEIIPAADNAAVAISKLRGEIAFLQGLPFERAGEIGIPLSSIPKGSIAAMQAEMIFNERKSELIGNAIAKGASLGIASGAAFGDIFSGLIQVGRGFQFSDLANIGISGQIAGLTPFGTTFVSKENRDTLLTVLEALRTGKITGAQATAISSFITARLTPQGFNDVGLRSVGSQTGLAIAQGGMHTDLLNDTLILAHKGERVDITPNGKGGGINITINQVIEGIADENVLERSNKKLIEDLRGVVRGISNR